MAAWNASPEAGTAAEYVHPNRDTDGEEAERARYLDACTDYLKRQILIYQNWPQRKYNELGYLDEVVFTDQNA